MWNGGATWVRRRRRRAVCMRPAKGKDGCWPARTPSAARHHACTPDKSQRVLHNLTVTIEPPTPLAALTGASARTATQRLRRTGASDAAVQCRDRAAGRCVRAVVGHICPSCMMLADPAPR